MRLERPLPRRRARWRRRSRRSKTAPGEWKPTSIGLVTFDTSCSCIRVARIALLVCLMSSCTQLYKTTLNASKLDCHTPKRLGLAALDSIASHFDDHLWLHKGFVFSVLSSQQMQTCFISCTRIRACQSLGRNRIPVSCALKDSSTLVSQPFSLLHHSTVCFLSPQPPSLYVSQSGATCCW